MRWLLIASMLFLPLTFACTSDSGGSDATESAGFKCGSCDKTSDTATECCGAPMAAI